MMRKVKVKSPKNSSTLKRMNINLYGDNVTAPKLELPTAQFGMNILGKSAQPDPGNFRSSKKTESIERAKQMQEAKDQGLLKTIGLGTAGFLTGALSSIPIIGGAFEGLNEKVQDKDKTGAAGIASGIGKIAGGIPTTVFSGGTMGTGDIAEGVGDVMGGSSEIAYNKGNDKKSERLGKAEQAFDTIAPMADMASGFVGTGAEGAEGMFKGPEGFKGGMKSLLGGMPSAKFGIKLPLEMELMPENGKKVDGYLHEEGGVITKHRGQPVAEIEGGEVITKIREEIREGRKEEVRGERRRGGGVVFSDTTINPETGKPFSRDAERLIRSKDNSKEGETTRRLAEEELYRKQERAKEMQGLENEGEMAMKKYKKGGSLKAIPSDNKGLPQLPESVRNQMGYMKSGGGLYANIHAKRERIRKGSGERMRKPGTKGAPTDKAFERAKETAMYGKKLNLPKMQSGDVIPKKQLKTLRDQVSSGSLTFANGADFDEMNMAGPRTAYVDGERQIVESPKNKFTDPDLRSLKVLPSSPAFGNDNFNYKMGTPSLQGDIYSSTEETATGKPALKSLSERLFRTPKGTVKKEFSITEKDNGDDKDGKGTLTPGDITQLAGNMVAPLANLAAMKGIGENVVDYGKDRSITREQRVSTADVERAARQEGAATRAGLTAMNSPALKSAIATGTTKAIQDAILQGERINKELAMRSEQARTQRSQFNVKQEDLTKVGKQVREDLRTTTGLTAAEQTGKALVDLGLTKNQGLTNSAQLKVLQEAFPDFTITADNMKSFIRDLSTGKEEKIYKYRT